ncbi:MAG: hypothetical protein K1060chlam2_01239 [Chlamydiae bacterium]|nr:hypothetical protein [Chlamydiota bacterium]
MTSTELTRESINRQLYGAMYDAFHTASDKTISQVTKTGGAHWIDDFGNITNITIRKDRCGKLFIQIHRDGLRFGDYQQWRSPNYPHYMDDSNLLSISSSKVTVEGSDSKSMKVFQARFIDVLTNQKRLDGPNAPLNHFKFNPSKEDCQLILDFYPELSLVTENLRDGVVKNGKFHVNKQFHLKDKSVEDEKIEFCKSFSLLF